MADEKPPPQSEANLGPLSPTERDLFTRASTAPMDVIQGDVKTYIDTMIELKLRAGGGGTGFAPAPGFSAVVLEDLTSHGATEYVYVDAFGVSWLYGNGAAVSQTTYADLYAFWGPNKWKADSGGNFFLPDAVGRGWFFCGTHANSNLGDNDGETTVANRQAKHTHQEALTMDNHVHDAGTLVGVAHAHGSGTYYAADHTHPLNAVPSAASGSFQQAGGSGYGGTATIYATDGSGAVDVDGQSESVATSISGATANQNVSSISGTIGTGTAGDAPAHIFLGSLLIAF